MRAKTYFTTGLVVSCIGVASACGDDDSAAPGTDAGTDTARLDAASADTGTDTGTTPDAAVDSPADVEAGADGGACLSGGTAAANVTGTGTCNDPYIIDMTGDALGTIRTYVANGGGDLQNFGNGGCMIQNLFNGTARDIVFHVKMPNAVTSLDVGVDAANGADPRVGVFEDPACGQPINACKNSGGAGVCEALNAARTTVFFGATTFVAVSEGVSSGQALTVRFRAN